VNTVKKARKDYPGTGIEKGDTYYWWKFRYGGKVRSKKFPRASQLTQSDKLSRLYGAQEEVEDALGSGDLETIKCACEYAASEIRHVAEEYQESADNIRDSFTDSPTADECEEKSEAAGSVADELESLDFEIGDEPDEDDKETWDGADSYEEAETEWHRRAEDAVGEVETISWDFV
jgi:hypothetical protein